jgi:hypothetical protein
MGHCEYTTGIPVQPNGQDYGAEFGHTNNPLPPPQAPLMPYRPTMLAALQVGPIVITHVHLRMYPDMGLIARPGWGAGMSVNIDKNLNWYSLGGNVNNQVFAMPDDNSGDLGSLIYDPGNTSLQAYFDWSGHAHVLTLADGLVLAAVNHGGSGTGAFTAIWDFDWLPRSEWSGPCS